MTGENELLNLVQDLRGQVERQLGQLVPPADQTPASLHRSMRHTLLAPGKRVRAVLTVLSAQHLGGETAHAMSAACALEMVHAASLILDDLPSMDDASLRRGQPANHCVYGDATAILAAIALLNRAYGVISEDDALSAGAKVRLTRILSLAVGSEGLVAGQEQDLQWSPEGATREAVGLVHRRKTAALFGAAAEMGAVAAGAADEMRGRMRDFGLKLGLAFQILDDLIDASADRESAGKDVSQDEGRPSLVNAVGYDAASSEARLLIAEAARLISQDSETGNALRHFAKWLVASLETKLTATRLGNR